MKLSALFILVRKCLGFNCQDFFGWSHESYRLHVPLLFTLVSAKPVHAVTHERHSIVIVKVLVTGNELPVVVRQ